LRLKKKIFHYYSATNSDISQSVQIENGKKCDCIAAVQWRYQKLGREHGLNCVAVVHCGEELSCPATTAKIVSHNTYVDKSQQCPVRCTQILPFKQNLPTMVELYSTMDGRNRKRKKRFALRRTTLASELLDMRRIEKKMQLDVSQKPSFVLRTRNYQKYKKAQKYA